MPGPPTRGAPEDGATAGYVSAETLLDSGFFAPLVRRLPGVCMALASGSTSERVQILCLPGGSEGRENPCSLSGVGVTPAFVAALTNPRPWKTSRVRSC